MMRIPPIGSRLRNPLRLAELGLLAALGLLAVLVLATAVAAVAERRRVGRLTQTYTHLTGAAPAAAAAEARRQEQIQRITERSVLAPPPPAHQLTGVLGDQAILDGGMAIPAGQTMGDVKVVAIGPDWADLEIAGKPQRLYVFGPDTISASAASRSGPRPARGRPGGAMPRNLPPGAKLAAPPSPAPAPGDAAAPARIEVMTISPAAPPANP